MTDLDRALALDELAGHLYSFLPGKPHPYADQSLSFPGVAASLGLSAYWTGGSKQPAIRKLLGGVLDSGSGKFSLLITKIVENGLTYRNRSDPITREEIERLNTLLLRLGFKIRELHGEEFLCRMPRSRSTSAPEMTRTVDAEELAALKDRLLHMAKLPPQNRGLEFERFLSDLFAATSLAPRTSFRLTGEQIDGSFQFQQQTFLLEAKWHEAQIGQADLLVFLGKVEGKAQWSRGLFVSYSGFSPDGLHAFAQGRRTSIICMDGLDLYQILDGHLDLVEVLDRKLRRAAETGRAFVPVRELFLSVT